MYFKIILKDNSKFKKAWQQAKENIQPDMRSRLQKTKIESFS